MRLNLNIERKRIFVRVLCCLLIFAQRTDRNNATYMELYPFQLNTVELSLFFCLFHFHLTHYYLYCFFSRLVLSLVRFHLFGFFFSLKSRSPFVIYTLSALYRIRVFMNSFIALSFEYKIFDLSHFFGQRYANEVIMVNRP